MFRVRRSAIIAPLFLLVVMCAGRPAFAQMDFSGEWQPIFYEDQPGTRSRSRDRGLYRHSDQRCGAHAGRYLESLGPDFAGMAVPAPQRGLHLARTIAASHHAKKSIRSRVKSVRSIWNGCVLSILRSGLTAVLILPNSPNIPGAVSRPANGKDRR